MRERHWHLLGGNTLDKYMVKLMPKAYCDLDDIEWYIANELEEPTTALNLVDEIENSILGLEVFPQRGALRKIGRYAGKGYRQIFVKNYTIVYRIDEVRKWVIVVTVKYTPSEF